MACIYKIQNKQNGKVYIGQTMSTLDWRLNGRWIGHFYLAFECNSMMTIHKALRKYGKDNFVYDVIEEKLEGSFDELHTWLNERETYWISKYDSQNKSHGYNSTSGGNELYHFSMSEATKLKMSINRRGKKKPKSYSEKLSIRNKGNTYGSGNKGKKRSALAKLKLSNSKRGKKLTDIEKQNRNAKMLIAKTSISFKKWMNNGIVTKYIQVDEVQKYLDAGWSLGRLKLNITKKRKPLSLEARKIISLKSKESSSGRKYIHKDNVNKFVKLKDLDDYLCSGWTLGRVVNYSTNRKCTYATK